MKVPALILMFPTFLIMEKSPCVSLLEALRKQGTGQRDVYMHFKFGLGGPAPSQGYLKHTRFLIFDRGGGNCTNHGSHFSVLQVCLRHYESGQSTLFWFQISNFGS